MEGITEVNPWTALADIISLTVNKNATSGNLKNFSLGEKNFLTGSDIYYKNYTSKTFFYKDMDDK